VAELENVADLDWNGHVSNAEVVTGPAIYANRDADSTSRRSR
jgi:hypothetical protein